MNASWFSTPEWLTLVHALLHTLWQAALAAGALFLTLRAVPAGRANLRYALSAGALALVLLLGVGAWALLDSDAAIPHRTQRSESFAPSSLVEHPAVGRAFETETRPSSSASPLKGWSRWAAAFWLAGVAVGLGRAVRGAVGAGRLRRRCRELTDPRILALADELHSRLRLARRVRFLISEEINVPAAMGALYPAVLLPAAMLVGVPTEQLRAILAHELAHLRRWDYLVNLGQMFVEALLFFNPFVWWISRQMRLEREACCDQLAARECQSPARYVEALVAVIERRHSTGLIPVGMLAASGPDRPREGGALDRARRLLVPGYLPTLRLRWFSLALVLAISGLALSGLWWGARAAAQVLTPQERIEQMTAIQKQIEPPVYAKEDITVSGTVTQEDGSPPIGKVWMMVETRHDLHSSSMTSSDTREGKFSAKVRRGMISIAATGDNYAPTFLGPLDPNKENVDNLHLVVKPGFAGAIQVMDEAGKPISGAKLTGYHNGLISAGYVDLKTDASGTATVAHAGASPLGLKATAAGYQFDEAKDIHLDPAKPYRWTLKKAQPFNGIVVSDATNQPIAGVKIKQAAMRGAGLSNGISDPENATLLATSDAQGRFTLDTLRSGARYDLYVEAPGGGILVGDVRAGQSEMTIVLEPGLLVRGKLVNVSKPKPGRPETITVDYSQEFKFQDSTYSHGYHKTFPIVNGEADFALGPLYAVPLEIRVGGKSVKLTPEELSNAHPRIDLAATPASDEPEAHPKREVVVHFAVPKNAPPPTGHIDATYLVGGFDGDSPYNQKFPVALHDGTAKLEVRTPNEITFESNGLIGYFFAERVTQKVPESQEPLTVELPVKPAGAIFGAVVEEDGKPSYDLFISVTRTSKGSNQSFSAPTVKDTSYGRGDTQNRFTACPLPFGESYAIVAHRNNTYAMSEPVRVDESDPIRSVKIVMPEGQTVQGRITNEDGSPASGIELHLNYSSPFQGSYGGSGIWTDNDGRFTIPGVNFAAPGGYSIRVESKAVYQPMEKTLEPRATSTDIQLRQGKILTGVLVDSVTGYPIAGAEVYAFCSPGANNPNSGFSWFDAESRTDDLGRFRFSNLPDAKVSVNTRNANLADPSKPLTVSPGQAEPLRIKVKLVKGAEARVVPPPQ